MIEDGKRNCTVFGTIMRKLKCLLLHDFNLKMEGLGKRG